MSDTATARHPDVSMTRRNPGLGHFSRMCCARCHAVGSGQGWAIFSKLVHCPECRAKVLARREAKKANA